VETRVQLSDSPIHKPALQLLQLQLCCTVITGDAQPRWAFDGCRDRWDDTRGGHRRRRTDQLWRSLTDRSIFSECEPEFTFAICYRPSVCLSSVFCNVRAPYSAGWNFR